MFFIAVEHAIQRSHGKTCEKPHLFYSVLLKEFTNILAKCNIMNAGKYTLGETTEDSLSSNMSNHTRLSREV